MLSKEHILIALRTWINQRPGLEFVNYGNISAYRSELRSITKDRRDALELLNAVALRDSITAADLVAAFPQAYSGRLTLTETPDGRAKLEYCTGQYWPTEYRKAACSVLASVLWDNKRAAIKSNYLGERAGDYIRGSFRREFGRSIAGRWFN